MGCSKHFLMVRWEQHDWVRRVSATASQTYHQSDMWSRTVASEQVTCHAEYVCRACGKIRGVEECGCDPERAERCAARLALINGSGEHMEAADR
jgi:hypothetical protein